MSLTKDEQKILFKTKTTPSVKAILKIANTLVSEIKDITNMETVTLDEVQGRKIAAAMVQEKIIDYVVNIKDPDAQISEEETEDFS